MNRISILGMVLLGLLSAAVADDEPAGRLEVALDLATRQVTLGDPIDVTLTVRHPATARLEPIQVGREWGPFRVREVFEPVDGEEAGVLRYRLVVALYRPGVHTLPPLTVRAVDPVSGETWEASTDPVEVTVVSVLPVGDRDLAAIRPPVTLPGGGGAYWLWIGLLVAAAAALLWWRRRRRRPVARATRPVPPPIPAHEWAYRCLRELAASDWRQRGDLERYFVELSGIVRGYLFRRYHIQTLERTTEELLESLRFARVPTRVLHDIRDLLMRCDLVKFARHQPADRIAADLLDAVGAMIEATRTPAATAAAGGSR